MNNLDLKKVDKIKFPVMKVLKNINIQINPDDRIGLLGVNGEGKSTFSKLIAKKIKLISY